MRKVFMTLAATAFAAVLSAEIVKNPDPNTLWIENGKNIKTAARHGSLVWGLGNKLKATAADKVFTFGPGGTVGIYIPIAKPYPWFCAKINTVERIGNNYHAFNINTNVGIGGHSVVSKIPRGTYCINMEDSKRLKEKAALNYMRMDIHSANITFESIGMFKEPFCVVSLGKAPIKKGTNVKVHIKTRKPVEMVQLKFYKAYTMPTINVIPNVKRYIAKPVEGKDNQEWIFEFPYNGFKGVDGKTGSIVIEALVETKEDMESYIFFNQVPFEK